jgi:hypothetical protein
MKVTANGGKKCNHETDVKRSARRIKIGCDKKYVQDKLLAETVIVWGQANFLRFG